MVSQADLLHGAQLQLRGALRMKDFDRRRIPTRGLEAVLLPKDLKANLDKIVHHEKVCVAAIKLVVVCSARVMNGFCQGPACCVHVSASDHILMHHNANAMLYEI